MSTKYSRYRPWRYNKKAYAYTKKFLAQMRIIRI